MIALTQGSTPKDIHRINNRPDLYGTIVTPRSNRAQIPQCTGIIGADNGAFSKAGFEPHVFTGLLEWLMPYRERVRFVACPDVVGDWVATLALFDKWRNEIRRPWPYPVAIVLQDGATPDGIPWVYCEAVFIGGTDAFKESAAADACIVAAKQRRKWVHVGRVSTRRRLNHFRDLGPGMVDSFDSSAFARWPRHIENVGRWMAEHRFDFSLTRKGANL